MWSVLLRKGVFKSNSSFLHQQGQRHVPVHVLGSEGPWAPTGSPGWGQSRGRGVAPREGLRPGPGLRLPLSRRASQACWKCRLPPRVWEPVKLSGTTGKPSGLNS